MIKKNLYIFLILASAFSFAQVNLYSEVNTKDTHLDSPITFTVVLEISGEDLIQETPVKLPDFSKFNYDFSSEQNTYIDPVKKIRMNQMIYQFSLDPKQTGNIKIGSALVKVNGKIYKTEPIDIMVKDADKKAVVSNNPAKNMYLNLQIENREVYKNEPVVAVLKAFSKNISNFRRLEPAKFENNKNFAIRSIANFDESIEESDNDYSSQVIGMFVIVPTVAGFMDIPPIEVPLTNHNNILLSNKVKINVKKLPAGAPVNFKNAVGKYDVKIALLDKAKENLEINKAFNVSVKITGNGNLSPSLLPKILPSADYETYEPKIINSTITTNLGIEGVVEAQYVVIPKKKGDLRIAVEDFSYFDPKEEKYVDLGQHYLALTTVNSQDIVNAKSTLQKVNEYTNDILDKVDSPVISTEKLKIKEHRSVNWLVIFGNFLIIALGAILFVFFYKRYRDKKLRTQQKRIISQPIINIAETEALLRNKKSLDIKSYINYLQKTLREDSQSDFFKAFEELRADTDQYCKANYSENFQDYISRRFGPIYLGKYNQLIININMEKYSPLSSKDKLTEILNEIEELYNKL